MENQQKAINMMMMFKRMLQEQREMSEITMVVQRLMQRNGQFNGDSGPNWQHQRARASID